MKIARSCGGVAAAGLLLAACGTNLPIEADYPSGKPPPGSARHNIESTNPYGSSLLFGDGLYIMGGPDRGGGAGDGAGIGVNSFLWRATLDTVSFLPLGSADPFGGVIITDWYSPPETPDERFKLTVYILDRALRADGVRVSVFRQIRQRDGSWADAPVNPSVATDLENAILTRARQLRIDTLASR